MVIWRWIVFFCCLTSALPGQKPKSDRRGPVIVQPGAPGKPTKTLTAAEADKRKQLPVDADIVFMQGMIHHHAQAVEMVDLLRTRGLRKDLQSFGERITISQSDEIEFMKLWLAQFGKPAVAAHDHANHKAMPLMPGMLTAEQMAALEKAKGAEFDRLFLTGMIQHHIGALDMVDDLFGTPGAGQEPALYDFAVDIDNTQRAEIELMRKMLKETK
ncbi:MAG: DUF305 domain-containing protein [Acidobacteria bacterium]|nr:DUF305 domain-containing protein [Acidobacteriota bacterium]